MAESGAVIAVDIATAVRSGATTARTQVEAALARLGSATSRSTLLRRSAATRRWPRPTPRRRGVGA